MEVARREHPESWKGLVNEYGDLLVPMQPPKRSPPTRSTASIAPKPLVAPRDESLGGEAFRSIDRMREALGAKATGGLSPAALVLALFDWSFHLAAAQGKQMELVDKAARKTSRLLTYMVAANIRPDLPPH